ncbi:hypothetical protein B7494_g7656 [Chlorociboria aeruginascens]|nr:hypothetical protein B7494_g7656 [Chlorociboria aeruginascens]
MSDQIAGIQSLRHPRRQKTFTFPLTVLNRAVGLVGLEKSSGYHPILVWVTPNGKKYQSGRRRVLNSNLTWHGHQIYTSEKVDDLISECDITDPTCRQPVCVGPFAVFEVHETLLAPPSDGDPIWSQLETSQLKDRAPSIFHHYMNYTAVNIMPFKHERNPWLSFYPLMARSGDSKAHSSLAYALLAQAAGHRAHLINSEDMSNLAMKYYTMATRKLSEALRDEDGGNFSIFLGSVLAIILAEVYNGTPKAWRVHLNGAWNFLTSNENNKNKPWEASEAAWLTAQSFCLLKTRIDTEILLNHDETPSAVPNSALISSVSSRPDYGFTIGTTPELMACISDTASLAAVLIDLDFESRQNRVNTLFQRLQSCYVSPTSGKAPTVLHFHIYKTGALIYFHRRIFNSTPKMLLPLISDFFVSLAEYRRLDEGRMTLWPIFVAAVEVYMDSHKLDVQVWLDSAEIMGAASRREVRRLIMAVWEIRQKRSVDSGGCLDEGEIVVDWREVMKDKTWDVLLI